jgi:hypothetical protein
LFPFQQAGRSVYLANSVDVRNEVMPVWKRPCEFDLKILLRLMDADTIVLGKTI